MQRIDTCVKVQYIVVQKILTMAFVLHQLVCDFPDRRGWCHEWCEHDDVIKWKHFPCFCPFVRGIHRSPVNSPHKGQWRGTLMVSLICARINYWVNNREAGDLRRHRAHYDVIVTRHVNIWNVFVPCGNCEAGAAIIKGNNHIIPHQSLKRWWFC